MTLFCNLFMERPSYIIHWLDIAWLCHCKQPKICPFCHTLTHNVTSNILL